MWLTLREYLVGILTRIRDKQPRHRGSNPENDKILSSETFRLAGCPYSRGVKLITHLHTVPSLRISGATPPLPHMLSWRAQGQVYLMDRALFSEFITTLKSDLLP